MCILFIFLTYMYGFSCGGVKGGFNVAHKLKQMHGSSSAYFGLYDTETNLYVYGAVHHLDS